MMNKHKYKVAALQMPEHAMKPLMAGLLVLAAILAVSTFPAVAQTAAVDAAKSQCLVGEMADGYLGFPKNGASEAVRKQVRSINIKRRAEYSSLSKKGGVTVEVAAALTAEKLIKRAKRGECVRKPNGAWVTVK